MNLLLSENAENIACFLAKHLTDEGVADPNEGNVLPHTYTTDFFAWLCALLYKQGSGVEWLERAITATDASLRIIKDWHHHHTQNNTQFHWEFKNLALLNVELLISDQLPVYLSGQLRQELLCWRNLNIDSANWTAMRALAYRMRSIRFGRTKDQWRSRLELALLLSMQTAEGFFPDTPDSHSLQYHAYTLSLLALYNRLTDDTVASKAFRRGIRFISDFIGPAGDFNYYGRGQRQLFGYASLILALNEAVRMSEDAEETERYQMQCNHVLHFVLEHRRSDGIFPLVLNHTDGRWGWYEYNNLGDYLAFCGVWFLLAATQPSEQNDINTVRPQTYTRVYSKLGLAVASRPGWFAAFSTGGHDLSEPSGLIHFWPSGPFCLGGPEPAKTMGVDYTGNYFGPLVEDYPILQKKSGTMLVEPEIIHLSFSLPDVTVEQRYHIAEGLSLQQMLTPKRKLSSVIPLVITGEVIPRFDMEMQQIGTVASPLGPALQYACVSRELTEPIVVQLIFEPADTRTESGSFEIVNPERRFRDRIWHAFLKVAWVLCVYYESKLPWGKRYAG